jgi:hypothetical protein
MVAPEVWFDEDQARAPSFPPNAEVAADLIRQAAHEAEDECHTSRVSGA